MSSSNLPYIALAVSVTALLLAFINFRRSDPRLNFDVRLEHDMELGLIIRVHNSGRAARTIDFVNVNLWHLTLGEGRAYPLKNVQGPALPYRLEGYSTQEWQAPSGDVGNLFWRYEAANLGVKLGGRRKMKHISIRDARKKMLCPMVHSSVLHGGGEGELLYCSRSQRCHPLDPRQLTDTHLAPRHGLPSVVTLTTSSG